MCSSHVNKNILDKSDVCTASGGSVVMSWQRRTATLFWFFTPSSKKVNALFFSTMAHENAKKRPETCCTCSHSGRKPLFSILVQVLACRHTPRVLMGLLLPPDTTLLWWRWWQTAVYKAVSRLKYDLKRANIRISACMSTCSPSVFTPAQSRRL